MKAGHRERAQRGSSYFCRRIARGAALLSWAAAMTACSSGGGGRGYYFGDLGLGQHPSDGGSIGNAVDLRTTPQPDLAMAPYPAGPYGNQIGQTLANKTLSGYRLSVNQTDSSQLQWDTTISFEDFHANPACKCLLITYGALWCGACQQEQPALVQDVLGDSGFCVLNILQEGAQNGKLATMSDVDQWTQHFFQDYPVVQGTLATEQLWSGFGQTIGLPFNFIVSPSTMQVLDVVQGFDPQIHDRAMAACGQ